MHEAGICFNDALTLPHFWPRAESLRDILRFVAPAVEEFSLSDLKKRGSASACSLPGSVGAGLWLERRSRKKPHHWRGELQMRRRGGRRRAPTGGLPGGRRGQIRRTPGPKPCAPGSERKRGKGFGLADTRSFPARRRRASTTDRGDK